MLRTAGKAALVRCILQPAARAMSRHAASQIGILADIMTDPHASVDRGRGGCAGCSPEARIVSVIFDPIHIIYTLCVYREIPSRAQYHVVDVDALVTLRGLC